MRVSWLRRLTTEVRVWSQLSPCGICGGQSGTGAGFSPSTCLPCQYHPTNAPQSSSHTCCCRQGQAGEVWEPPKKQCSYVNRKSTVTIVDQLHGDDRQPYVITRLFQSCAYFCTHCRTPLPRGVYYNLNIPKWGHTPCRTTPISPVNYAIKRPLSASLTQTTSQ